MSTPIVITVAKAARNPMLTVTGGGVMAIGMAATIGKNVRLQARRATRLRPS
jgi:hypothetical protein